MKVVFDENFSHVLPEFLARVRAPGQIQHVRKLGWNGKADDWWIPLAVKGGFSILTADRNEMTRGLRAEDLKAMGAQVLMLGPFWDHLGIWEKSKWLVSRWDSIAEHLSSSSTGSCWLVNKSGWMTPI